MMNRKCLVESDEEDEDGNFSKLNMHRKISDVVPMTEVVFLESDTSCFQPEDVEEMAQRSVPITYIVNSTDDEDSDVKIIEPHTEAPTANDDNDIKKQILCIPNLNQQQKIKTKDVKVESSIEQNRIIEDPAIIADNCDIEESILSDTIVKDQEKVKTKDVKVGTPDKKPSSTETKTLGASDNSNKCSISSQNMQNTTLAPNKKPDVLSSLTSSKPGYYRPQRRSKYSRLNTPVCDSIMKDYTKNPDETDGTASSSSSTEGETTNQEEVSIVENQAVVTKSAIGQDECKLEELSKIETSSSTSILTTRNETSSSASILTSKVSVKDKPFDSSKDPKRNVVNFNTSPKNIENDELDPLAAPLIKLEIKEEAIDIEPETKVNVEEYIHPPIPSMPTYVYIKSENPVFSNELNLTSSTYEDQTNNSLVQKNGKRKSMTNREGVDDDPTYVPGFCKKSKTDNNQEKTDSSSEKQKCTATTSSKGLISFKRVNRSQTATHVNRRTRSKHEITTHKTPLLVPQTNIGCALECSHNGPSEPKVTKKRGRPFRNNITIDKNHSLISETNLRCVEESSESQSTKVKVTKKRGRPPKKVRAVRHPNLNTESNKSVSVGTNGNDQATNGTIPKKRGRPFKQKILTTKEDSPTIEKYNTVCVEKVGRDEKSEAVEHRKLDRQSKKNIVINSKLTRSKLNIKSSCELSNPDQSNEVSVHDSDASQIQAKSVAEKLKLIVEKITGRLESDQIPDIEKDTEKLLQTAQELLELQKQKSQFLLGVPVSNPDTNPIQALAHFSSQTNISNENPRLHSSVEELVYKLVSSELEQKNKTHDHSDQSSLLGGFESPNAVPSNVLRHNKNKNRSTKQQQSNFVDRKKPNIEFNPSSVNLNQFERTGFAKDYILSYQNVFCENVINTVIPTISEIVLLCMDVFLEFMERLKKAENITSQELRSQEVGLAKDSFAKVILTYGPSFFPKFDAVVKKIDQFKKSDMAVLVTFLSFILTSVIRKAPRFRGQIQLLISVLKCMCKTHNYSNHLVWSVLGLSVDAFNKIFKAVFEVVSHFEKHSLKQVSLGSHFLTECLLGGYMTMDVTNSQSNVSNVFCDDIHSAQFQNMNLGASISMPDKKHSFIPLSTPPLVENVISMPNLPDIAAQFVETLQNEREFGSKRIEEKLDSILSELRKNSSIEVNRPGPSISAQKENEVIDLVNQLKPSNIRNTSASLSKRNVLYKQNLSASSMPTEVVSDDGLDNLFEHMYLKSAQKSQVSSNFVDCESDKNNLELGRDSAIKESEFGKLKEQVNQIKFQPHFDNIQNDCEFVKVYPNMQLPMEKCDVSEDLDDIFFQEEEKDPLSF